VWQRDRVPYWWIMLAALSACSVPADPRPGPVGRVSRAYVDSARTDWLGAAPRPIATTVWYPAATGSREVDWQVGVFRFGRSAPDATFADAAPRPLILLSHGTGGSVGQLAWLAEALAADGFVVAGVNHHGNTAAESEYQPAGFVLPWERALDVSVLIDRLVSDPTIGSHIDTTRIGAAGFSLGGFTVLAIAGAHVHYPDWQRHCAATPSDNSCVLPPEASFTLADVDSLARTNAPFQAGVARNARDTHDPRVRAAYAMAPALVPLLDSASLQRITVPLRIVLGERDAQVPAQQTQDALSRHRPHDAVDVRPGVSHYAFLAECSWRGRVFLRALCSDGGSARRAVHAAVTRDAVQYFRLQFEPASRAAAMADDGVPVRASRDSA
jgi:predicted dienelactone hydrolase